METSPQGELLLLTLSYVHHLCLYQAVQRMVVQEGTGLHTAITIYQVRP